MLASYRTLVGEDGLKASIGATRNEDAIQPSKIEQKRVQNGLLFDCLQEWTATTEHCGMQQNLVL